MSKKRKNKEADEDFASKYDVKKKRVSTVHNCLVHCREDSSFDEIISFTLVSWNTATQASKVRQDCLVNENEEVPNSKGVGYHRKCYQSYTNSKALAKFRQDAVTTESRKNARNTSCGILAPKECIICNSKRVNRKSNSGYETLEKCVTTVGAETLISYNERGTNPTLNILISGKSPLEIVALEVWHHRTCMRDITRKAKPLSNPKFHERKDLFEKLLKFVQTHVVENGDIRSLSSISDHYESLQQAEGLIIKGCLLKNIKSRLFNHFGDDVDILRASDGKEFLYCPKTVQLIGIRKSSKEKLSLEVKNIAAVIRDEIASMDKDFSTWPPCADDLYGSGSVPEILSKLLFSLLSQDENNKSTRISSLVNSIGQDIIYSSTRGQHRTKKHVSLGLCLKRKTGSKDILTWLNKLGHCVSYDEVNRIETCLAEFEAENSQNQSFIPSSIQPKKFTSIIADNGDHNPESLFGLSLHCTNMIMVQGSTDHSPTKAPIPQDYVYRRRRSFKPIDMELSKYAAVKRTAPSELKDIEREQGLIDEQLSRRQDFLWIMARLQSTENQTNQSVPSWTGFNYLVSPEPPPNDTNDTIAYLPSINKSPTEMATVNEVLKLTESKAKALQISEIDLVFDHAIYCKALEILNDPKNLSLKKMINLRMGGFHAECIFMSVIAKRFLDGGLKDLVIEAEILPKGSTVSSLSSPHYNKAIRVHKYIYEALMRCKMEAFEKWLVEKQGHQNALLKFKESAEMNQLPSKLDFENYTSCLNLLESDVMELYETFEEILRQDYGPTANYWLSYLDMVQTLLDFQRSLRSGDWDLHLRSTEKMLPWFHAYDRHNYARHFTYYWCSQQKLGETHPQMHAEFVNGHFSVKRSVGRFNRLPSDQIIEQTMNKEQKGKGGIIGCSTSESTVQRWIITSYVIAKLVTDLKANIGVHADKRQPKDLGKSRIKHDEQVISRCVQIIEEWSNPFEKSDELTSLSSGKHASKEVLEDIMNAQSIGEKQLQLFVDQRISSNTVDFYDPIKRLKLKTFTAMKVKKTSQVKGKQQTVESSLQTFSRFIILQQKRNISIKEVLKYELGALPLSIACPDGGMVKSAKAKLGNELKKVTPEVSTIPGDCIHIYDGMVLLQKVPKTCVTFGAISDYLLNKILSQPSCKSVIFVTDRYLEQSTKSIERNQRSTNGAIRYEVRRRDQVRPKQYEKFLRDPDNKMSLVKFLLSDWAKKPTRAFKGKDVYVTVDDMGFRLYEENGVMKRRNEEFISSTQEEADTKMFLCAKFASITGCSSVCIHTIDTDVLVLAYYYSAQHTTAFSPLDVRMFVNIIGKAENKIFDVTNADIDDSLRRALPGLHAITGCDAVSAFYRRGKVKALRLLQRKTCYQDVLSRLGEDHHLSEERRVDVERFVCDLYGQGTGDINEARYQIFKKGVSTPELLPPTRDALRLHMDRANKVVFEWKAALYSFQEILPPEEHGWKIDENGDLQIQWTTLSPAPEQLLEYVTCSCKKKSKCQQATCECRSNGLCCTDMCKCSDCQNEEKDEKIEYGDDTDDDDDSSDEEF